MSESANKINKIMEAKNESIKDQVDNQINCQVSNQIDDSTEEIKRKKIKEEILWVIDNNPTIAEDGEILDIENEDSTKNNQTKKASLNQHPSSDRKASNKFINKFGDHCNKASKVVKIIKKHKNQPKKSNLDYSKLSEQQLEQQFRQVYQQIQFIEQQKTDQPQFHLNQPNQSGEKLNNQVNNSPNNQFNSQANSHFNQFTSQTNSQFNNQFHQLLNMSQQFNNKTDRNSSFTTNQSPNGQFNPKKNFNFSGQSNLNLDQFNKNDLFKLKEMFTEMSKIIMKNIKSKEYGDNQKKFGKKKFNKKINQIDNEKHNSKNKINKLKDKKMNSTKKRKGNNRSQTSKQPNKSNSGSNFSNATQNKNSIGSNSSFEPVITSDLFNSFKLNNNGQQKNSNSQICKYFLAGSCNKGDRCEFIHSNEKNIKVNELCKYYVQDACEKGSKCIYLHKEFPCKYYHTGTVCNDDKNCKFSHDPLSEEMKIALKNFLNPKEKFIKKDKVLLGNPTPEMRNSHNTWLWQQEIRKLETKSENENTFKISNEFLIKDEPLVKDLTFKRKLYTEDETLSVSNKSIKKDDQSIKIKKENLNFENFGKLEKSKETNTNELTVNQLSIKSTINKSAINLSTADKSTTNQLTTHQFATYQSTINEPINQNIRNKNNKFYQRRTDLMSIKSSEQSYEKKIEQIISGNKLHQLYKSENLDHLDSAQTNTLNDIPKKHSSAKSNLINSSTALNSNLYKPYKESDNLIMCSSNLINQLAEETKVDSLNKEMQTNLFTEFKTNVKENQKKDNQESVTNVVEDVNHEIKMVNARNLIDKIMNSKGLVCSGLASLTNQPVLDSEDHSTKPIDESPLNLIESKNQPLLIQESKIHLSDPKKVIKTNDTCYQSSLNEFGSNEIDLNEVDLFNNKDQFMKKTELTKKDEFINVNQQSIIEFNNRNIVTNQSTNKKDSNDLGKLKGYIISKDNKNDFKFKLHLIDKIPPSYYEYQDYYYQTNDVRLARFFSNLNNDLAKTTPKFISSYYTEEYEIKGFSLSNLASKKKSHLNKLEDIKDP